MTDKEKVMWSLARCSCGVPDACSDCHYDNYPPRICVQHLTSDALALLKAQEPRVMTLKEAKSCINVTWIEIPDGKGFYGFVLDKTRDGILEVSTRAAYFRPFEKDYGVKWRCWNKKPTPEQMEATPWMKN